MQCVSDMGQGNPAAALSQSSDNKKKLLAFYQGLCTGTLILHRLGVLKIHEHVIWNTYGAIDGYAQIYMELHRKMFCFIQKFP